ncbi:hypothetical protein ACFFMM_30590 [Micromonospora chaiyaphumensis]|uniref:Uncharacterized protein n=1 Tax=Micromonospora chaiyaphumensis TaxID=307119 RepID=A0A1C4X3Y1_9ACTN|nr:hypothetical protein [Micromonospora chaiyaphumensis]SCF03169.1 hypothetical protein GA0070214_10596 [Micromonospora chaiyaphumensis]
MNGHRMDQETVERLLVGPVSDPQDGPQALVRFLAAVRADPHPQELSGEGAALQAFRRARAGDAVPVAVSPPRRRLRTGLLGAKLALGALLATATGGVALAAVTGNLPGPLGGGGGTPVTPSPGAGTDRPAAPTPGPSRPVAPSAGPTDVPGTPSGLAGLCTAYRAKKNADRGHALEAPPFAALVAAAGGRDKVPGYCDGLLDGKGKPTRSGGDPTAPRPSEDPTRGTSTGPTARVTGPPEPAPSSPAASLATTTHPDNRPAEKPDSVRPSSRPR